MTTLEEQINNQKKHVLEQKRQIMEAEAERILEHAFRRNDMDSMGPGTGAYGRSSAPTTEAPQKAFKSITKTLTKCEEISKQLSIRSGKLVSSFTGMNEPQKEVTDELEKVDSFVLLRVLSDIEAELCRNLSEISDNLEKLENAW